VVDRLTRFYRDRKVQPYGPYPGAQAGGAEMDEARTRLAAMMGVKREEVSFGPSTSANTYVLAQAVRKWLAGSGGAVVVTNQDHEANSGVWRRLADEGIEVREWKLDRATGSLDLETLDALLADGKVKLKTGAIERVVPAGLQMADGSELKADLIVWATGYGSMNGWVAQLVDQATADKLGKCWGLGSGTKKDPGPWEGELRNMWKPTQVKNLWMQGGNLHQNRHYSLCTALQLKARMEGLPTPVYGLAPVHHKA
jgi:hypothetical protein